MDEMVPAVVAEQLRAVGRDAEAVSERRELHGLPDGELFEYAQAAQRSLVTYNRDDFLELDGRYRSQGRTHRGIVVLNPRRFPQVSASIEPIVASLDQLIDAGAPYDSFIHWLQ